MQDIKSYADSVKTIRVTNKHVAEMYIADGGADMAVPPLKALLYIMRDGEYEGMTLTSPEFRAMWTRENIIKSDWYMERLKCFQTKEIDRLQRGLEARLALTPLSTVPRETTMIASSATCSSDPRTLPRELQRRHRGKGGTGGSKYKIHSAQRRPRRQIGRRRRR